MTEVYFQKTIEIAYNKRDEDFNKIVIPILMKRENEGKKSSTCLLTDSEISRIKPMLIGNTIFDNVLTKSITFKEIKNAEAYDKWSITVTLISDYYEFLSIDPFNNYVCIAPNNEVMRIPYSDKVKCFRKNE